MNTNKPTENEALRAQQDDAYDHGPQAETVEEAARDVGKWLNERPNRPLDLRHAAMLTHHAKRTQQPAPATQKLKEQVCISDINQSAACAVGSVGTTSDAQTTHSTHDAPATQQAGEVRRAELVPGVMHCAKCKFQLNRVTLCVSDGNAYAGNNKTEPCPNGCGPLWPVTWEQEAKNCWKALEEMHERLMAAAAPQPSPMAQAASSAVLKAIREANMQLVRTGDDAFMLVPYKAATAQAAESVQEEADLPPLPDPDLRDVGTKPQDVKDFLNGYATEYARLALAARAPAESVGRDAERERICAAIKAEDDYCVTEGDYMLDSNDCIKIVRGEWVRPDFSVVANGGSK